MTTRIRRSDLEGVSDSDFARVVSVHARDLREHRDHHAEMAIGDDFLRPYPQPWTLPIVRSAINSETLLPDFVIIDSRRQTTVKILARLALACALALVPTIALGQSSPGLFTGQVPTAAQWNSYFAAKQDYLGFAPLNPSSLVGTTPISVSLGAGVVTVAIDPNPTFATSVTTPLVIGNTTVAGQLRLQSTSNASPALDFMIFKTGGADRMWLNAAGALINADSSARDFGGASNYQAYNVHSYQNFIGYTRSSDDPTAAAPISGYFVSENDSLTGPQQAWGVYAEGRAGNFGFTAGAEIDTQNTSGVTARTIDPNSMFGTGSAPANYAIWSQADGSKSAVTPMDSSAWAGVYRNTTSGNRFLKGLVFDTNVIQTVGGHKEAINFGADQEIVWYAGGGATGRLSSDGSFLSSSTGFLIGTTTPQLSVGGANNPELQVHRTDAVPLIAAYKWANDATGVANQAFKSRGATVGAQTIIQNNDVLGNNAWGGSDGSVFRLAARFVVAVDGTPGASDMPGRVTIETTPDGSATPVERLRISNTGHTNWSGTAPALSSCGTSPAITGNDMHGTVTMGTATPTGCVITFALAYAAAPTCRVTWRANIASMQYTVSTTAITLTQTATSSNLIDYDCWGA